MSDNVVKFPGSFSTLGRVSAEQVLEGALEERLEQVVVVGFRADGALYLAASDSYLPDLNLLLDLAKARLVHEWDMANNSGNDAT